MVKSKDSHIKSLTEAVFNILVGFSINFTANAIILPLYFGIPFSFVSFFNLGLIYTIISLIRSYVLRRMFVNGFYEWCLQWKKR
jgi:hypothetical protein